MQSYTNYLYYNYTNNIGHFQEIIDNLIKGRLLPENMNEQIHNKMKEWFGPDWLFVFGYNVCDKNYSKPQIHKSDPIYKFITVSFLENNEDDDAYDLFVEEARAFLINTVVKLFSHDNVRLSVYGDITQYKFCITDYFEVFQNNLNELTIYIGQGSYTLFNKDFSYSTYGDHLDLTLNKHEIEAHNFQFTNNYYAKIKRFGINGDIDELEYFGNSCKKSMTAVLNEREYDLNTFLEYTNNKEELIVKEHVTIYKVDTEGNVLMDTPLIDKEIVRRDHE
jgi:hypothetical protein|nr:MAG TPA: hypothetical protein [Caudoviricetes sp.]